MKPTDWRERQIGPLKKKTLHATLTRELRQLVPSLGDLTASAVAKRVEQLIEEHCPPAERLQMGQILWPAVDSRETPGYGKSLDKVLLKPVCLTLFHHEDVEDYLKKVPKREIRQKVAVRLFQEAYAQGGVLSGVDVGSMMGLSAGTIYRYIREHEKGSSDLVPRRGTIHDMGPTLTHKREICYKVIVLGMSIEETARSTRHSPEAVTRYVQDYRRVHQCMKGGFSVKETAFATKLPERLVHDYKELAEDYRPAKFPVEPGLG